MDFLQNDAWDSLMSQFQLTVNEEDDLDESFIRIKNLLERKSKLYWHIRFFNKYEDHKINP